eukprot:gene51697-39273_t
MGAAAVTAFVIGCVVSVAVVWRHHRRKPALAIGDSRAMREARDRIPLMATSTLDNVWLAIRMWEEGMQVGIPDAGAAAGAAP